MKVEIRTERQNYQPGEAITGIVSWTAEKPPRTAELRLFWHTKGKGDRDSATAECLVFELPQPVDSRPFSFSAPSYPPSFSGKLISLLWGLELVLDPGGSEARDLVIAPDGLELELDRPEWLAVPEPPKMKMPWSR